MNIQVFNPRKHLIVYGLSKLQEFSGSIIFYSEKIWGISPWNNEWYPNRSLLKTNSIDLSHFNQDKFDVDMLLDLDKKELRFCVVGMDINDETKIAILKNIPQDNASGFVPYFNLHRHSHGAQLRIIEVPISWYGQSHEIEENIIDEMESDNASNSM